MSDINFIEVDSLASTEGHIDYPDQVGWDLSDDAKISVGRDGEGGPWVIYLGLANGDIYATTSAAALRDWAEQVLQLIDNDPGATT